MTAQRRVLPVAPLEAGAFAPFGDVIEASPARQHFPINGGTTMRYNDLMQVQVDAAGRPIVSIFRGQPRTLPFAIRMLERHPLGSQAFVPMQAIPYLVVVAPPAATVAVEDIRAFLAQPGQGVNYAAGVWHHPLLALQETSDFLVLDRSGPGHNCDECFLPEPLWIEAL